jgi:hypothetical protein
MFWFKKNIKKKIGRLEYIDIPELDLYGISAKIDTGAYRGAIHATDINEVVENGIKKLTFKIFDEEHPEHKDKIYESLDFNIHKFRGTKTKLHDRYVIPLKINIAGEKIEIELSLTDRKGLRYPVLLGRRALKNKFLIDVDKEY